VSARSKRGISLLEVCVTLALVGAAASVVALQLPSDQRGSAPAARPLLQHVRAARVAALRTQRAVTVSVMNSGRTVEFSILADGRVVAAAGALSDSLDSTRLWEAYASTP
jgi:Tfp pilus assembly protein FimT